MMKSLNYISQIKSLAAILFCITISNVQAQGNCVSTDYNKEGSISEKIGQSFKTTNCSGAIFHSIEIEKADSATYSGNLAIYNGESIDEASLMYFQSDVNVSGYGFQAIFLNISGGSLYFACGNTYTFLFSDFEEDIKFNSSTANAYKDGKAYLDGFQIQTDLSFRINVIEDEVLPVAFTNFDAKENLEGKIDLSWATASELNNAGFEVQHSTDAENFEAVGWVAGNGTSNTYQAYSFTTSAQLGKNYFRLKQIDLDGNAIYSNPLAVSVKATYKIGPNPTSGIVNVRLNSFTDTHVKIFNATGDLIDSQTIQKNGSIDLSSQPAGIYMVQITTEQERIEQRIIKI
ncbi:T9SS type A sorting domain-containing protein [Fulvivirga sp. 29W222]|uniref:T9SS type A sorting domain-containing protein n=1 Tax=Fulvivirga marina TaxID=2494733 RepID=A0A937KCB7_9BACT|nr:T9SS type A sorting domain-containing protein [Fulvivirga marina]MBL6444800.1 T9SS type A sorting domain-containing protein [Fulvivirga marina]